jgi:hypothetical protein
VPGDPGRTPGSGIIAVRLERQRPIDLVRPGDYVATMTQPGNPTVGSACAAASDAECLADELRRLDADETYADVLRKGLPKLAADRTGLRSARRPRSPRPRSRAERLRRNRSAGLAAAMVTAEVTDPAKAVQVHAKAPAQTEPRLAAPRRGQKGHP